MYFILKLLILTSFLAVYSPANANDFSNLRQNEAYAGAYFTFKFGGDSKSAKNNRFRYGLAGGLRRSSFGFNGRPNFSNAADTLFPYSQSVFSQRQFKEVRILDTAFDSLGFKHINFANIPVYKRNKFGKLEFIKFGFEEEKSGTNAWKILKWVAIVGGGLVLAGFITLTLILTEDDFVED